MKKKKLLKSGQKILIDLGFFSEEHQGKTEEVTVNSFDYHSIEVINPLGTKFFINQWNII